MISKRLKAICDLVPISSHVIDVGADHAYTSIYLEKEKKCSVLATDISSKCIEKAKANILKNNSLVEVMVTDGLNNIKLDNQIIIISGMGAHTIRKILDFDLTNDLIISAHRNTDLLKEFLLSKNYYIYKEINVFDKRDYNIIYFKYDE